MVPVFSVPEIFLRNLTLCFTSVSSAPPLFSIWNFLLSTAHPVDAVATYKKSGGTGHGSASRQCGSGKLQSLDFCCLSILPHCLSEEDHKSHWKLLQETIICGFIFPISRCLCTGWRWCCLTLTRTCPVQKLSCLFSHARHQTLVMENELLQKLGVLPTAGSDSHWIYHSSQCRKIEHNIGRPWDGNGKQRDNFITAAPNGRDTGNKIL